MLYFQVANHTDLHFKEFSRSTLFWAKILSIKPIFLSFIFRNPRSCCQCNVKNYNAKSMRVFLIRRSNDVQVTTLQKLAHVG